MSPTEYSAHPQPWVVGKPEFNTIDDRQARQPWIASRIPFDHECDRLVSQNKESEDDSERGRAGNAARPSMIIGNQNPSEAMEMLPRRRIMEMRD